MTINAGGVFLMSKAVVPHVRTGEYLAIIGSDSGMPQRGAYCASKAAVIGFTRSLAYDLASHGITVSVCPVRLGQTGLLAQRCVPDGAMLTRACGSEPNLFSQTSWTARGSLDYRASRVRRVHHRTSDPN